MTPDNGMNPNMRSFRHNGTMTATFPPSESIVMAELIKELELPVDYFPFSFPRAPCCDEVAGFLHDTCR